MEIILLQHIEKLGNPGDVVTVKSGFARNYLIPQEKALRASKENKEYFAKEKAKIEEKNQEKKQEADIIAKKWHKAFITIIRQAGEDGKLYGSVLPRDIANYMIEKGAGINRSQITFKNPVKQTGIHQAILQLHPEIESFVYVNVARSEDEAKDAHKKFTTPQPGKEDQGKNLKPVEDQEEVASEKNH